MKTEFRFVTAKATGPARDELLMGRTYKVFPAQLVQEQVLHNNLGLTFLPAEDINAEWAEVANAAPVVMNHPTDENGNPLSARSPAILNGAGLGFLFNTRAKDGQLKADVYLDTTRSEEVTSLQAALESLDAGDPVELSTGFAVAVEETAGVHNGRRYDRIIHPIGFDHLAILSEGVGACSISDGCGLGVNEGQEPGFWGSLRQAVDTLIANVRRIYTPAGNESDSDKRQLLADALRKAFGDEDTSVWVEDVFSDANLVVYEVTGSGEESGTYRVSYLVSDDGAVTFGSPEAVRKVTTYEPVEVQAGNTKKEEEGMNREQMIAHLAEAGPLGAEELAKLTDCQLKALMGVGEDPEEGDDGETPRPGDAVSPAEVAELRRQVAELVESSAEAVAERDRQRSEMIAELVANDRCPWDEAELKTKSLVELRKVRALLKGENYVGQGGPRQPQAQLSHMPVKPYWEQTEKEGD